MNNNHINGTKMYCIGNEYWASSSSKKKVVRAYLKAKADYLLIHPLTSKELEMKLFWDRVKERHELATGKKCNPKPRIVAASLDHEFIHQIIPVPKPIVDESGINEQQEKGEKILRDLLDMPEIPEKSRVKNLTPISLISCRDCIDPNKDYTIPVFIAKTGLANVIHLL